MKQCVRDSPGERPVRRTGAVLKEILEPTGKRILDVGCGTGTLVRWLLRNGAEGFGVDPQWTRLRERARQLSGTRLLAARGESLPFADACFDAVVFLNSLHHVPEAVMEAALTEAVRVARPRGRLVIVEPIAEGGHFEVMQPVEDESRVRDAACRAVRRLARRTRRKLIEREYLSFVAAPSAEALLAGMVAVDPGRGDRAGAAAAEVRKRWQRRRHPDPEHGWVLDQPMRVQLLAALSSSPEPPMSRTSLPS